MASIVTINASTTSLSRDPGDTVGMSFDVANTTDRTVTVRAQMISAEAGMPDPGWLQVQGEAQFTLAPAETRQLSVGGTPPEGEMRVALEVFETALPEENVDRSAPVQITAGAAAAAGGRGWVLPAVIAAAVLVLAIGGGVAWWLLRDPGFPDVEELSQADAVAALAERDYTEIEIVPVVAPDEEPGTVLSGGIVDSTGEGAAPQVVRLEVAMSGLPDVAGLSAGAAERALLEAGAGDVETTLVAAPRESAGKVVGQDPVALSAFDSATVVALAVGGVEVPDLRGQTFNAANRALRDAGLVLGDRHELDDPGARRGTVLRSDPRPGTLVAADTPVDLMVDSEDPVVAPPRPALDEDCLGVDPGRLQITRLSNGFRVGEADRSRFLFDTEAEARRTIAILQKYEIDEICYVERPQPPMMFLKTRGAAPQGALTPEKCVQFNPERIAVRSDGAQWVLVNLAGGRFRFDTKKAAELAEFVIQKYRMTHLCGNGGDFSKFHYFRR